MGIETGEERKGNGEYCRAQELKEGRVEVGELGQGKGGRGMRNDRAEGLNESVDESRGLRGRESGWQGGEGVDGSW